MSNMTKEYKPIQDIMLTLNEFVERSGMSLREVSRKLEKEGFNLYNVCTVANGKPEQLSSVVKFDNYIHNILRVTGHDEYDLIKETLENLQSPNSASYQENLPLHIKEFLRNPESQRYIEYAYKKYKLDKLAEEQEILRRELQDMK